MSPRTVGLIEAAEEIKYGVKQEGHFEHGTIAKLVDFYRERGVTFVALDITARRRGPGIYFKPRSGNTR